MSKIFIHVGLPKTATTFLQTEIFPFLSRTTCLARPYTQQYSAFKQLQYADTSLYDSITVKHELDKIVGERTIISDECFVGNRYLHFINRSLIAERFSQIFPEAEIIIFLRGQESILVSIYNQALKAGRTVLPVEDFIWQAEKDENYHETDKNVWNSNMTYFNSSNHRINLEFYLYSHLIELYQSLFKKVHIFLYEEFKQNPKSVVKKILSIVDDHLVGVDRDVFNKTVNSSLGTQKFRLKRYENQLQHAGLANNKYISKATSIALATLDMKTETKQTVKNYIHQISDGFYAKDNRKLIDKYPAINLEKYSQAYQL